LTPRRAGLPVVVAVCLLLAAACGSTVDPGRLAVLYQDPGAGLGAVEPSVDPSTGLPVDPSFDSGAPGGPAGPDDPSGPTPFDPSAPGAPAVGVTEDTISIGFIESENADQANQALGSSEVTAGDGRAMDEALIEDLNKRGGIAGHRVVPVFGTIDATSNETFESQFEGLCQTFTRDHHVYGVVGAGQVTENFLACMEAAGSVNVNGGFSNNDARIFPRYPHYIEVAMMNLTRGASITVDGLFRAGYFGSGAKIGVVTYDSPQFENALREGLLPALARHGLEAAETRMLSYPDRLSDAGTMSSQASSAALRFKTQNVTHVLILDYNALATVLFMEAADNAEYAPKYGLNSQNGGSQLATIVPSCCAQELHGALLVGWSPAADLGAEDYEARPKNASYRRCVKLMAENGVTFDSANAAGIALISCDSVWFLEQSVERAAVNGLISADTFLAGVHGLGTGFLAADPFQTRFDATHHDGISQAADMVYLDECSCFRYTSAPYAVP
jgi:hypothetical protein